MAAGAGKKTAPPYGTQSTDIAKEDGCCSVNFLKYVLHIFNIVLFLSGVAVLGVGAWTVATRHNYVVLLTTSTYALAAYVLIVAGILAVLASILLLLGLLRENRCCILGLTFLLLLIFLLEAMVGMLSYIYEEQVQGELAMSLNDTFLQNYNLDPPKTHAIDEMQREYKCCGAIRFEDWEFSPWYKELKLKHKSVKLRHEKFNKVPDSCCITESFLCGKSNHPSNIFGSGCLYRLAKELKSQLIILGATGLGICAVQVFGMIFSCCLYIKLRELKDYDQ
ncbi:CD151 antigen-like [Ischnura elegans]|uniref:CD151 antigen-like n=1 Tax=Ischnura elegans TaxID=197161 RepID=UPI001ED88DF6|nr:CD151 antigen-like [Ischnura elegans]XP_046394438.1 CD151 antigen-like [Ischnura elegans]XP_046394439.1 CD151 antigen-like [Ischnura elegans]XP_046394440.1 CD151 antigen-like [Ischnura elegans]XP_046394441.1 CD151 antigen-like [Ischnura elegans]XP_046394442.1 CD151 antigen-like [Ischnura elegans]